MGPLQLTATWYKKHPVGVQTTVFTRISAAALIKFFAPQVRRLFEGGAYLKIGRHKQSNIDETLTVLRIVRILDRKNNGRAKRHFQGCFKVTL